MQVEISEAESRALNKLRGLPQGVFMMIVTARPLAQGETLQGEEASFQELIEFIDEEIAEGMVSGRAASLLFDLCVRMDPSCADWLGA